MALSAFAFSVMALLVKVAGSRLPSSEIVFVRALIGLFLSFLLLRRRGLGLLGKRRGLLILRGVLGFIALSCFFYAVTKLPLGEVTILFYLHPLFTAVLATILLREAISIRLVGSTVLSLIGIALVTQPSFLFGGESPIPTFPMVLAIVGAFFSALAYITVRALSRTEEALVIVFYFPLVAVPASFPLLVMDFVWPVGMEWGVLLLMGIFTQIGQITLTKGLAHETAGRATALSYLQVVFAVFWGALFFAEKIEPLTALGALSILLGSLLVAGQNKPVAKVA